MRGLLCPARVQRALITLRQATCGAEVSLTPNSPQAQIKPLRQDRISSLRHFPLYRCSQVCLVGHKWSVDEVLFQLKFPPYPRLQTSDIIFPI